MGNNPVGHFFHKVGDGIADVGKDVVHGVETGVKDVAHVASKVADTAAHAVVTVGDDVAHVVSHVPIIGDTLSQGLLGVTDLVHKADQGVDDAAHAAEYPIDTAEEVYDTVKNPHKLMDFVKKGINTVGQVADDVKKVATVVGAVVAPESDLGIAAADAASAANDVSSAVNAGSSAVSTVDDLAHGDIDDALSDAQQLYSQGWDMKGLMGGASSGAGKKKAAPSKRTAPSKKVASARKAAVVKGKKVIPKRSVPRKPKTMVRPRASRKRKSARADGGFCCSPSDGLLACLPHGRGEDRYAPLVAYLAAKHPRGGVMAIHMFDRNDKYLGTAVLTHEQSGPRLNFARDVAYALGDMEDATREITAAAEFGSYSSAPPRNRNLMDPSTVAAKLAAMRESQRRRGGY